MQSMTAKRPYVLGLDLGVSSLGWAVLEEEDPPRIRRAGVHLFEAGIDGGKQSPENALQSGKEQSRAAPRRDARQQRRQTWRRAYRKRVLLKSLIRCGLLPEPESRLATPEDIDGYLKSVDAALRKKWESDPKVDHRACQVLMYRLRAEALRTKLDRYEVGRALYHLAQRRGFLSNRKTDGQPEESERKGKDGPVQEEGLDSGDPQMNRRKTGQVSEGISELQTLMTAAGAETLGQFFASIDPADPDGRRIRSRWTARGMYEHEFGRIWDEQARHYSSIMTGEARVEIRRAIFRQRPLKSQRHLIGRCSLAPGKRRAPIASRLFQQFRMLQKVNDLEVIPCSYVEVDAVDKKTGEVRIDPRTGKPKRKKELLPDPLQSPRRLTSEERQAAIATLIMGDATFAKLRSEGAAPKESRFNLEHDGENSLPGLRTDAKLRAVFGERWDSMTELQKDAAVEDCLSIERADVMEKRGRGHWALSSEAARAYSRIRLEEGYASFSSAALRKILPSLDSGIRLQSIIAPESSFCKELFPRVGKAPVPLDVLPSVDRAFGDLASPAVARALTEVRRVVNAIVRQYGKPAHIRIELARELKKGRKRRAAIAERMAERRRIRERAAERLLQQYPGRRITETDKLKVLLADECNWCCPYCDEGEGSFGWAALFGDAPTIDIEHIWPFSRSLDDSFVNKTLCCHRCNREEKKNCMPAEAYAPDRLEGILQHVMRFRGDAAGEKLERFKAEVIPEGFARRHLSETQYISRKAAEYLSMLYGGYADEEGKRRVHVPSGGLTAWLRTEWKLNAILSDRDEKERCDHRHHAIDAIVIACTTPATIQKLQLSAARSCESGSRRRFAELEHPFDLEDARRAVEAIVVSHRQNRKVRGGFHNDTIYSKSMPRNGKEVGHRARKLLDRMKENEIDAIVDPRIREIVRAAYAKRKREGARNPAQAFGEQQHRPKLPHGDRIRRVRLYVKGPRMLLGASIADRKNRGAAKQRWVQFQANHHTVIAAKISGNGGDAKWRDDLVSRFEAISRVRAGAPVVCREMPSGFQFLFSLSLNEYVELDAPSGGGRAVYRVKSLSDGKIGLVLHSDNRDRKQREAAGDYIERGASWLRERKARKVTVSHLGEVRSAGG